MARSIDAWQDRKRLSDAARLIVRTPRVCGGEARIDGTRITVRSIELLRRQGKWVNDIRDVYPWLSVDQVEAALTYADHHSREIDDAILANEG